MVRFPKIMKRNFCQIVLISATVWALLQLGFYFVLTQQTIENINFFTIKPSCYNQLNSENLNWIFAITPTYKRATQKAELTRLSHTLRLVPKLHWILVEDSESTSSLVSNLLTRSQIPHTHLFAATPEKLKLKVNEARWKKPRGVQQRNAGIEWLRRKRQTGVVYFADDDNTYDLQLFEEMRSTKKVSVWPVGLVGGLLVEGPLVKNGMVVGWHTDWRPERPYAIDMAGFAVNLEYLLDHPEASFSEEIENGFQESHFLSALSPLSELEPKADNCTKVYVWHTRTEKPKLTGEDRMRSRGIVFGSEVEV